MDPVRPSGPVFATYISRIADGAEDLCKAGSNRAHDKGNWPSEPEDIAPGREPQSRPSNFNHWMTSTLAHPSQRRENIGLPRHQNSSCIPRRSLPRNG
jgi:hypothetical protein